MKGKNSKLLEQEFNLRDYDTSLEYYKPVNDAMIVEKYLPSLLTKINIQPAFTIAGDYEQIIRLPEPIFDYHRALPGTVEEFRGKLKEAFSELSPLTKEELDKINRKRDIPDK